MGFCVITIGRYGTISWGLAVLTLAGFGGAGILNIFSLTEAGLLMSLLYDGLAERGAC